MPIDISKLSVIELKALGYDLVIQRTDALRRAEELASYLRLIDQRLETLQSASATKSPLPPLES